MNHKTAPPRILRAYRKNQRQYPNIDWAVMILDIPVSYTELTYWNPDFHKTDFHISIQMIMEYVGTEYAGVEFSNKFALEHFLKFKTIYEINDPSYNFLSYKKYNRITRLIAKKRRSLDNIPFENTLSINAIKQEIADLRILAAKALKEHSMITKLSK
jgi:hypothetical protein